MRPAEEASELRAGERDRTADLPFTRWKLVAVELQAGRSHQGVDRRQQGLDGWRWLPAGVHGGTFLDHRWDQVGPRSCP
jgi:hypothetical protein